MGIHLFVQQHAGAHVLQYQQRLAEAALPSSPVVEIGSALLLDKPVPVTQLPGFDKGDASVQDAAAQRAVQILGTHTQPGGRLLDACSAPGGKTAHAAESEKFAHITAIDSDAERLERVNDTLTRLSLIDKVHLVHAVDTQQQLLDSLWHTLKDKGVMLYATCSVLKAENEHQVRGFLQRTSNARLIEDMVQIFPGQDGMDGFFYAAIEKCPM